MWSWLAALEHQKASNDRLAHYLSRASTEADEQRLIKDMQAKRDTFLHEGVDPAVAALKSLRSFLHDDHAR